MDFIFIEEKKKAPKDNLHDAEIALAKARV